jgi:hypothetical protein
MIVTDVGMGCGGRGGVGAQARLQGGQSVSDRAARKTNGALPGGAFWRRRVAAYGKSVWSWHPLLVSSRRRFFRAQPGSANHQFADDGGKTNSSPGRARYKP